MLFKLNGIKKQQNGEKYIVIFLNHKGGFCFTLNYHVEN